MRSAIRDFSNSATDARIEKNNLLTPLSLTGSVPVKRAGMASGTADLQRDLGGAILQSIFGALLTAGYAASFANSITESPHGNEVSEKVQNELTKSFSSAADDALRFTAAAFGAAGRNDDCRQIAGVRARDAWRQPEITPLTLAVRRCVLDHVLRRQKVAIHVAAL